MSLTTYTVRTDPQVLLNRFNTLTHQIDSITQAIHGTVQQQGNLDFIGTQLTSTVKEITDITNVASLMLDEEHDVKCCCFHCKFASALEMILIFVNPCFSFVTTSLSAKQVANLEHPNDDIAWKIFGITIASALLEKMKNCLTNSLENSEKKLTTIEEICVTGVRKVRHIIALESYVNEVKSLLAPQASSFRDETTPAETSEESLDPYMSRICGFKQFHMSAIKELYEQASGKLDELDLLMSQVANYIKNKGERPDFTSVETQINTLLAPLEEKLAIIHSLQTANAQIKSNWLLRLSLRTRVVAELIFEIATAISSQLQIYYNDNGTASTAGQAFVLLTLISNVCTSTISVLDGLIRRRQSTLEKRQGEAALALGAVEATYNEARSMSTIIRAIKEGELAINVQQECALTRIGIVSHDRLREVVGIGTPLAEVSNGDVFINSEFLNAASVLRESTMARPLGHRRFLRGPLPLRAPAPLTTEATPQPQLPLDTSSRLRNQAIRTLFKRIVRKAVEQQKQQTEEVSLGISSVSGRIEELPPPTVDAQPASTPHERAPDEKDHRTLDEVV